MHWTEFIMGKCEKLHIHIQRIPSDDIPHNAETFSEWLSDQFAAKEKLVLKNFTHKKIKYRAFQY